MLLGTYYQGVNIHREERMVYAHFLLSHRVISTCPAAGGLRDDHKLASPIVTQSHWGEGKAKLFHEV